MVDFIHHIYCCYHHCLIDTIILWLLADHNRQTYVNEIADTGYI